METLYRYVMEHSEPETEVLRWVRKQTNLRTNHARMLSSPVQGAFLRMLAQITGARRVLELGAFTGYSTICLAEGVGPEGHVDTLEINDELVDLLREGWRRAGVEDRITLAVGDCLETISRFAPDTEPYDLVYIDANKRDYCAYFQAVMPFVRKGGLIVADNTLWDGKILQEPLPVDAQTQEIARFNEMVAAETRVETIILPLRDGLTLMRVK